jgi:hypothetical protein
VSCPLKRVHFRLVLVAVTLVAGASTTTAVAQPLDIIDALVHTSFDNKVVVESKVMFSKEELAAEMKRNHVVGAVSMNRPGDPYADLSDLNIINCANLVATEDATTLETGLASKEYRCITIYLGYVNRYAYDPANEPTFQLAEKYDVPVVLYSGGPALKYGEPDTADLVARSHPRVTFALAHAADPRTIAQRERDDFFTRDGQFHFFSFAYQTNLAAEVAYENPNVVLDGSGLLLGDLHSEERDRLETYLVKPVHSAFVRVGDPAKLLFGTGWPVTDIGPYIEAFKRAIPREYWQAVFHDNAARVYGFGKASPTN